jgi:hypothetical protein
MPYSEAELAAARDFFLSPANFDETDPTCVYPGVIDSLLTNMSGQTVRDVRYRYLHTAKYRRQIGARPSSNLNTSSNFLQ